MSSVEDIFQLVVGVIAVVAVGIIWFLLKGSGPKPTRPKTEEKSPTSKGKRKKAKKGGDIVFFEEEENQTTTKKHREASDGMAAESLSGLNVVSLKAGGVTTTKKAKKSKQVAMPSAEQIDKDLNKGFVCIKKSAGASVRGQIDEEVEETPAQKKSPKGKGTEEKKLKPWERELPIFKKEEVADEEDDKGLSEHQKIRKMIQGKRLEAEKKAAEKEKISGKVLKPGKKKTSSVIGGSGQDSPRESQKPWGEQQAGASSSSSHLPDSQYPKL
eukprot:TRINITY_DN84504_c0_g1_i1.p1 TRINITY_DN84504_c0_g1~~TRINITY_DN84504_c0_g1_i1.p1  ORF type:complete len:271 (+),score=61.90 TRINITY_DN84504_c0_g1_i1:107-919(+)